MCCRARNRTRWKLEHASGGRNHTRDVPGTKVLFQVHDDFSPAQEKHVNGKAHPEHVDASRWHDPQPSMRLRPAMWLAEQTLQSPEKGVRHGNIGRKT